MTAQGTEEDDLQTVERLAANDEDAHEAFLDGRLCELHTCLPGIIDSYDPATQTAKVQPAIKRVLKSGPVSLPLCVDVPIVSLGGGGFRWTFPIKRGDECLLFFAERSIDGWFSSGGVQLPSEVRFHDLSDGFAMVGPLSKPNAFAHGTANAELWAGGTKIMSVTPSGNVTFAGSVTDGAGKVLGTHQHQLTTADVVVTAPPGGGACTVAGATEVPT